MIPLSIVYHRILKDYENGNYIQPISVMGGFIEVWAACNDGKTNYTIKPKFKTITLKH
ncbi:MAG: hypothetical protein HC905_21980 [Bacteroidales bacterium]|nr:hypothetical protein [Bacteroidales bacterium]